MRKFILIANLLIACIAAGVIFVAWRNAWRPLAVTKGRLDAPVAAPVSVVRDEAGVPHISAASVEDALTAQGYATAQDRLFQMDAMRRLAAGEIAEIVGAAGIENDREARALRMKRIAEEHVRNLPPADHALMAAYARGVNQYIAQNRENLPVEFRLLRYDPKPWTVQDSILVGLQMYRSLTSTWKDDLLRGRLRVKGDAEKLQMLYPVRTGQEEQMGSNAWVISGKHTASGKPILANDTHLAWSWPSAWYMNHLKAPGLNVSGFSLPGVPAVIIGHNERIAWGVTNSHFDVQDLYIEQFDPATGRYRFNGSVETARREVETIRVKDRGVIELTHWVTRHGPLVVQQGGVSLALRWTAADPAGFAFAFVQLNQASNWEEFNAALRRFPGPAQNFLYADVDGNIGFRVAGALPVRRNFAGDLPASGAGEFEWDGFIPFDQLPSAYNPPSGMLVSANQNSFPADYPFRVGGGFAPAYRQRQIAARLSSRQGWKAEDMLAIQMDVYSAFSHFLAKQTAAAWDKAGNGDPQQAAAIAALKQWDGQMNAGSSAAFLTTLIFQHLRKAIGDRASDGQGESYDSQIAPAVVERLLRERPAGWFADFDAELRKALAAAVEEARKLQGTDPAKWTYGRYTDFSLPHPVLSRAPYVGKYFVLGPHPMEGSSTTVKQTSRRLGPSMRFVADLAQWENSLANITIGQSGQPLSPHFRDQWDDYLAGRSLPMHFTQVAGDRLELTPIP